MIFHKSLKNLSTGVSNSEDPSDETVYPKQSATLPRYADTVVAQGVLLALGVVSGVLSARILGPSGRGILSAITLWPMALAFLFSCGINQSTVFHLSTLCYRCQQICGALLCIGIAQSILVVSAGIFILPIALRHYPPQTLRLGFWFLLFTPILILGGYPANVLQALRHTRWFNIIRMIAPATFVVGLALIGITPANEVMANVVKAQLAGYVAAFLIGIALLLTKLRIAPEVCMAATGSLFGYGVRAQMTNLATYFNQRADQLVLSLLVPPRELGLYAVAVSLGAAVTFVPQAAGLVTFADAAGQGTQSAKRTIATSFRLSLAWLCMACVLLWVAAPFLVAFAFGKDFSETSRACRFLLPGMVASGLNQVLYAAANAMGRPALPSFAELAGMAVTAIGFVILVPSYGYIAAAAVSTAAYTTSFVVMIWLSTRVLGIRISELLFAEPNHAGGQAEQVT